MLSKVFRNRRQKEKTKGAEPNKVIKRQKMAEAHTKKGKKEKVAVDWGFCGGVGCMAGLGM
ncbi:hypothetical protein Hanom_Chr04g00363361 [Helianthus anomalus]